MCPAWSSAQPTDATTSKQGSAEEEEGWGYAQTAPSLCVRWGGENEVDIKGRTAAHDDHDDCPEKESKFTVVAASSSTVAKHKATELPANSPATATPATVATLVAAAGSRHPVSFERQHQHVPFHDRIDDFRSRRARFEGLRPPRNRYVVAAEVAAAGTTSSISGRPASPEVATIPKPWTLRNKIGAATAGASKKGNRVCHVLRSGSAKRETSSTRGPHPAGGGGTRRWNLVNAETNAIRTSRRKQNSAAAVAARIAAGKQRWGGLRTARNTTSTFMHVLNVRSNSLDNETSSNASDGDGEGHGDNRSRRRGRRGVGAGAGGSGSEDPSPIWRESSSDYNSSSDNSSFDEEVGGRVSECSAVVFRRTRKGTTNASSSNGE